MKTIKKIAAFFIFWYNTVANYISFYYAKNKANKMHKLTGKRFHVVPGGKNKLIVVDNTFVDIYNRRAKDIKGAKKITINDLLRMSYYSTSVQGITRK